MRMHNPPHPGLSVRSLCLDPLGLSVSAAARILGVSRKHLSQIVHGHAPISADTAVRLSKAFGGDAEVWVRQQADHDLWQAEKRLRGLKIAPVPPRRAVA
ncbi:MAG: HigA family addiction module antidote protein [Alphaproteobacteria bacterium]|nr:HigA family addiction module antidote protein [Alphaproteobacteria bacterium]